MQSANHCKVVMGVTWLVNVFYPHKQNLEVSRSLSVCQFGEAQPISIEPAYFYLQADPNHTISYINTSQEVGECK